MKFQQYQSGSSLLFCMVFLVILSVLAIGTMSTSYLDEKMAANVQFKNQVFQAGQSEGQGQYDHYTINHIYLEKAYQERQKEEADREVIAPPKQVKHEGIEKEIELSFTATVQPPSGFSFDVFQGLMYDQDTVASLKGSGSSSDQTLGINYAAPKDSTKI